MRQQKKREKKETTILLLSMIGQTFQVIFLTVLNTKDD